MTICIKILHTEPKYILYVQVLKWIIHPKMKILSLFTQPHVTKKLNTMNYEFIIITVLVCYQDLLFTFEHVNICSSKSLASQYASIWIFENG